jgi:hypothetical protein
VELIGKLNRRYIALSYVWGDGSKALQTTTENFGQLCLPGAFDKPENRRLIPRTILDSMVLASEMDTRFLWVDMLCIRQNDPDHLAQQLQQMASVYGNSYFTIIAANGPDAWYGLRGVGGDSAPRNHKERILEFSPDAKMIPLPKDDSDWSPAMWHTRGWTFQERVVSPRTFVFVGDTVYWQCRSARWHENLVHGRRDSPCPERPYRDYSLEAKPWPDLKQYFTLVEELNKRTLTKKSDALNAFASITTVLSNPFSTSFFCGIPECLFDLGLLWSSRSSLERRPQFSSWSWIGWSGRIQLSRGYTKAWRPVACHFNLDENEISELDMGIKVQIHPLFKWYRMDRGGHSRIQIENWWHRYAGFKQKSGARLPRGVGARP